MARIIGHFDRMKNYLLEPISNHVRKVIEFVNEEDRP